MSATQETIREEPAVSDPESDHVGAPAGPVTREDFADASDDLQVEGAERAIASAERERAERRERQTEPPPKAREDMSDTDVTATMEDTNEVGNKYEHLYKILIIGELGTGKTSIIKRYVHQFFSAHYRATIGVDFALKVLHWDPNTIVRLQLWDIAGQERFGSMTRVYYKEAVAAFIVFDVTRSVTFDAVMKWKNDLDEKVQLPNGDPVPCVLLGNKSDLAAEGLATNPDKVSAWASEHGFAGSFTTSAKENKGIEEAAQFIVSKLHYSVDSRRQILAHEKNGNLAGEGDDADVMAVSDGQPSSSSCSC